MAYYDIFTQPVLDKNCPYLISIAWINKYDMVF